MKTAVNRTLNSSRKGQSLIEAMVALTILMVGLMGVLNLISRSLFLQHVTADQAKATYIASEGIEIAKSLIDHDVYLNTATAGASGGWGSCFSAGDYNLDYTTRTCITIPNYQGDPLYLDPQTSLYYTSTDAPAGSTATGFVRKITISYPNSNAIKVQSTVTWSTGTVIDQHLVLEDTFYNWHP